MSMTLRIHTNEQNKMKELSSKKENYKLLGGVKFLYGDHVEIFSQQGKEEVQELANSIIVKNCDGCYPSSVVINHDYKVDSDMLSRMKTSLESSNYKKIAFLHANNVEMFINIG